MIEFVSATHDEGITISHYVVKHSEKGRDGKTVYYDMYVESKNRTYKATLNIDDPLPCDTIEKSIDKLALHLEMMAKELRSRVAGDSIPVYGLV